jgi:2-iminobutanoate/2-iminopropanoate deaminase
MKEAIQPEGLARPAAPYSPVVVSGDLVYTAGQVGFDESGQLTADDITGQTVKVFENLVACLRAAGCEPSDVIKVNAYLTDLGDFAAFNEVYKATFAKPYPARTTVGVSLPGGILVEVEALARRPER